MLPLSKKKKEQVRLQVQSNVNLHIGVIEIKIFTNQVCCILC